MACYIIIIKMVLLAIFSVFWESIEITYTPAIIKQEMQNKIDTGRTKEEAMKMAIELCSYFEGFSARPYRCPAGVWTIGYGSTRLPDGGAVKQDTLFINKDEAKRILSHYVDSLMCGVLSLSPILISYPNRLASITSFAYNFRTWEGIELQLLDEK